MFSALQSKGGKGIISEDELQVNVSQVGGSTGFVSTSLAEAYPDLTFEVQDLKHTAEQGALGLAPHLKSRIQFVPHDFFSPQPTTGDVYLMRHICHDWSSKYAAKILQAIVPVMKPTSKILLIENVMEPVGVLPTLHERTQRFVPFLTFCYLFTLFIS